MRAERKGWPQPLAGLAWMGALVLVLVWAAAPALAQTQEPTQPPPEAEEEEEPEEEPAEEPPVVEEEITVTGTRFEGRSATDTPAPVDYIDNLTIKSVGALETGKILQLTAPSSNFSTTFISDGTDAVRPVTLRGLGPDQTLLLVNGKRRHQTALVHYQQTVGRGSAGYDINTIPAAAIDHIEVLRDGAAAQYGSDAIAGVINVILKEQTDVTDVTRRLRADLRGRRQRHCAARSTAASRSAPTAS